MSCAGAVAANCQNVTRYGTKRKEKKSKQEKKKKRKRKKEKRKKEERVINQLGNYLFILSLISIIIVCIYV